MIVPEERGGNSYGAITVIAEHSTARAHDVPVAMMGKLPLEFKTLALGTHREFDTIAADAEANGTPKHALAQLADVLQKCVACHASYQVMGTTNK